MILGFKPQIDTYTFLTKSGDKFDLRLRWVHIDVPSRDGTETMHRTIFDLKTLILKRQVAYGTTADEAFAAIKFLRSLPPTDEFDLAIQDLQKFLNDNRKVRTYDYLARMIELYGREIGATLFTAIGKKEFKFPAFHLREKATADFVKRVLNEYPGVAGCTRHIAQYESLIAHCHRCGGSKFSAMIRQTVRDNPAMKHRVDSGLQAAKYIETCNQLIGVPQQSHVKFDTSVANTVRV